MKKITLSTLNKLKQSGEKITCLTAYDATFAQQLAIAGVEIVLVGDSLGMVLQGRDSTVAVTMENMIYHTQCTARGLRQAEVQPLLIADMPYMSYATPQQTFKNAAALMQAGAQMVKVEGGSWLIETIQDLSNRGVPVCGHLGLTPQSVDALGGYKVQGRTPLAAAKIKTEAAALAKAGIRLLVLECVPAALGEEISQSLDIPVIGIGAGVGTDAQVLVLHDMLGITPGFKPKFVKNFMQNNNDIQAALKSFVADVKNKEFPSDEHSFE
jgi:3-methyl-2-oxobutanoate hydroxymethyltransferase